MPSKVQRIGASALMLQVHIELRHIKPKV